MGGDGILALAAGIQKSKCRKEFSTHSLTLSATDPAYFDTFCNGRKIQIQKYCWTHRKQKDLNISWPLRLLFTRKPFWHICASLCTVLCPLFCAAQHWSRVRGDSYPNWAPPTFSNPNLSRLNDGEYNQAQYCCCYIIMQWSLPLLFSLVQDSPPDGLSHTLWRTGGGERGGDPKKQQNSVWLKKRIGSLHLIDKVL